MVNIRTYINIYGNYRDSALLLGLQVQVECATRKKHTSTWESCKLLAM